MIDEPTDRNGGAERTDHSPASSRSPTRRAASARPRPPSTSAPAWPTWVSHAGRRSRPAGQRLDRARHRHPQPRDLDVRRDHARGARSRTASSRRRCKNLFVAPASLDLAGAEIELVPAFSRELRLAAGDRSGARRLRLRPDRLSPVARTADGQRAGCRRRGARADPVRVLRARGTRPAVAQRRPRRAQPEPDARGQHDRLRDVRRSHQAGRPGRAARCASTSATRCAARWSPARSGCPRRRRSASRSSPSIRSRVAQSRIAELAKEVSGGAPRRTG